MISKMIDVSSLSLKDLNHYDRALCLIINSGNAKSDDYPLHEAIRREIVHRHSADYQITGVMI